MLDIDFLTKYKYNPSTNSVAGDSKSPALSTKAHFLYKISSEPVLKPELLKAFNHFILIKIPGLQITRYSPDLNLSIIQSRSLFGKSLFIFDLSDPDTHQVNLVKSILALPQDTLVNLSNKLFFIVPDSLNSELLDLINSLSKLFTTIEEAVPTKANADSFISYWLTSYEHVSKASNLSQASSLIKTYISSYHPSVMELKALLDRVAFEFTNKITQYVSPNGIVTSSIVAPTAPADSQVVINGQQTETVMIDLSELQIALSNTRDTYETIHEHLFKFIMQPETNTIASILHFLSDNLPDTKSVKTIMSRIYSAVQDFTYASHELNPSGEYPANYKAYRIKSLAPYSSIPLLKLLRFIQLISKHEPEISVSPNPLMTLKEVLQQF